MAFLGVTIGLYVALMFLITFYIIGELLLFPEKAYLRMELWGRHQQLYGSHTPNTTNETRTGKGLELNPIQPVTTQIEALEVGE